jgi:V8-like Glu-specific endopeptidase
MTVFSPTMLLVPLIASVAGVPNATGVASLPVPQPNPAAVVHEVPLTLAQQRDIVRYWTLDRMAHAIPPAFSLLKRTGLGVNRQTAGTGLVAHPPAAPAGREEAAASSASSSGALWPAQGAVRDTLGKVYFSLGGRDFVCSASTVTSANRDLVVTAGHCAKDGIGAWTENWIFVPGYRDGAGPYGGFTARKMYVPDRWSGSATDDYDVAMVALAPENGEHVVDAVGAQGIDFGGPRGRQVYAFGYPATGQYDGERLAYCSGRPHDDPHSLVAGQGLRCDMTQGSSGGAWLSRFDSASGRGVITSVSSFKYADDGATMYGPYFGGTIRALYDQAQHG